VTTTAGPADESTKEPGAREKIMKTLRDSVNVFALLLMVTAAAAIVMPLVSRGQGDSRNAPPHRTLRTFYVTQTTHRGNQTLTACSSGYHMASLWEIFDMSNLRYDTQLGMTAEDSGFGPPTQTLGWIRTGVGSGDGPVAGLQTALRGPVPAPAV
jgi:hypothetical protein